jgi:hypothetical protein
MQRMNPRERLIAQIRLCRYNLAVLERRRVKGYAWLSEHLGWHAIMADAERDLESDL